MKVRDNVRTLNTFQIRNATVTFLERSPRVVLGSAVMGHGLKARCNRGIAVLYQGLFSTLPERIEAMRVRMSSGICAWQSCTSS